MQKEKLALLGIAILAGLAVWLSFTAGLFTGLENFFEDILFSPKPVHPDIVIVAIDSESITRIGQWPWPRKVFTDALSALQESQPKAVGIDVVFSEPSRFGADDDRALAQKLRAIPYPTVLAAEAVSLILERTAMPRAPKLLEPLSAFTEGENVTLGHVNLILDPDGVVRTFPPVIANPGGGELRSFTGELRSFAYELVRRAEVIRLEEIPTEGLERIVYAAPVGSIKRVPFYRILDGSAAELVKNKIILIGATSPDLHDEKPTPMSRGTEMPGVEIQTNIVNMLLNGYRLAPLHAPLMALWIFIAALFPAVAFQLFKRTLKPILLNLAVGIGHTVLVLVLFDKGVVGNLIHLNLAWALSTGSLFGYRYFSTERDRRRMRHLFSKYVSNDVLEEILKDPTKVKLGGEEKEVTVFFSDIRGFTTLSEATTPTELVGILNRYFTAMTNEILKHGGVIDKYIGDAIMAFWGAPIDDPEQADHALQASFGMLEELKKFNEELRAAGDPEINIGIGLYTGPAIVGNVGSEARFDYTVIGDTVNVASRLEGLNKEYKTSIIIGETTKNKLKGQYNLKPLGSVSVKGRKEPLNIYTVIL